MPPTSGELCGYPLMSTEVTVDCLMPTGIVVPLVCNREATLNQIKFNLFIEARRYPLFGLLRDQKHYSFVTILKSSDVFEQFDESRRLCDLNLFKTILRLVEASENSDEKKVEAEIHQAVGSCILDYSNDDDDEVVLFRREIMTSVQRAVCKRESGTVDDKLSYIHPPEIEPVANLSSNSLNEQDHKIQLNVWLSTIHPNPVWVAPDALPSDLLSRAVSQSPPEMTAKFRSEPHLIKVCGMNQYLLGEYKLVEYKYIRECLCKAQIPQLILVPKHKVYEEIPPSGFVMPSYALRKIPAELTTTQSVYQIKDNFKVLIKAAHYLNVSNVDKLFVKAGLFHGTEALCNPQTTRLVDNSAPDWREKLTFDLMVPNIPRSARLCLCVCALLRKSRESVQIGWANVPLFDYKNILVGGKMSLALWPVPKGMTDLLNPLGTTARNLKTDCAGLTIEFDPYSPTAKYPSLEEVCAFGQRYRDQQQSENPDASAIETMNEIIRRDPLYELTEQDKSVLWNHRYYLKQKSPNALPKLLDSVVWSHVQQVSEMYRLLEDWPTVSADIALELLDCKYPDHFVRERAVGWLHMILPNKLLSQFLLQLVQVLKYEPYLNNSLGTFLLERSLLNYKIGHYFFWHLKSEMHDSAVTMKFGLLLEAFCRGMGSHLRSVVRQVGALDKLTQLTESLKSDACRDRRIFMEKQFAQEDYLEALRDFPSPLNNSLLLGELQVSKCRVMTSAKKPLWLVWSNPEFVGDGPLKTHQVIFKNGDDLRQDMLTLQVIRIMDAIWKEDGLDLRMMPYACLSTGENVGMIEVVKNAMTVMDIQRTGLRSKFQIDSNQLHRWIREKNDSDTKYKQAIETFTHSCAGYCVATFVLGIGDRNPDNIMVNEDGQIFHIDFGHFLGHFKKKFGINRERVPFVLTEDFVKVISRGEEPAYKSEHFKQFQRLCFKAYESLHKHSRLLITLFTMMLSTGIPELQSIEDIGYIRKTLQVEKNQSDALNYFQAQLSEAYERAWSTKLDWFFHSVKHISKPL